MGHSLFWTFVFLLHTASNTPSTSSAERSTMRTRCCPHTDSSAAQKLKHLIWTLKLRLFGRHKWSHCMQMLSTEAYDPSSAGQWLVWEKSLAMQSHGALILLFTVTDWKKKLTNVCVNDFLDVLSSKLQQTVSLHHSWQSYQMLQLRRKDSLFSVCSAYLLLLLSFYLKKLHTQVYSHGYKSDTGVFVLFF